MEVLQKNMQSGTFKLAIEDQHFLKHEHLRGARLMLEYEKTEHALRNEKIISTIVAYGSARVPSPEQAEELLANAKTVEEKENAQLRASQVHWYQLARNFAKLASIEGGSLATKDHAEHFNVIATGGGPGIMEAANRGAFEAGAPTIGYTIELPFEEKPNPYTDPHLTFKFHYFAIRKMHLALRASALAAFPGGYGTLDELFLTLNLFNTTVAPHPIILFDKKYWTEVLNLPALAKHAMISPSALDFIDYADSAEEGWEKMLKKGLIIKK